MTSSKDSSPDRDQIDHWMAVKLKDLKTTTANLENGFYVQKNIPFHYAYGGSFAMTYSGLGRVRFLNGEPIEEVRSNFRQAAQSALRAFKIVYDSNDPLHQPGYRKFSYVTERSYIEGAYYALIADDWDLAAELSRWFRNTPDEDPMDPEVNDFAFSLKYTLLGEYEKALALLRPRLEKYLKKPPKGGYKRNYYTLTTALVGILERDEAVFNEGLALQLHFHLGDARGEYKNMPQGYICDDAVALANLGLHHGLNVTVTDYRLPPGLLIGKEQ